MCGITGFWADQRAQTRGWPNGWHHAWQPEDTGPARGAGTTTLWDVLMFQSWREQSGGTLTGPQG